MKSGMCNPYYNMALDELLLNQYEINKEPVLRIYGWDPATISLGLNQDVEQTLFLERCRYDSVPFVRRITGGSAIFHDDEITYSIVCSEDDINNKGGIKESYKILCSFIINSYKKLGLNAYFSIDDPASASRRGKGTFCFSSWEEYDIVINGKKIGGNAQKRKKKIILQHGSIPLTLDFKKVLHYIKDVPKDVVERSISLYELAGRYVSYKEMEEIMKESFEETFSIPLQKKETGKKDEKMIKNIIDGKYNTKEWNFHRKIKEEMKYEQ